eukprot:CAMPEP_0174263734 /NCGR_PEP_ID=MMETSP0439-20130205/19853_1 /TAXON_ID=0 /ORGANISM="Stereomyxa ramosa, Strain Chinc5" /LENGTH=336 /DNA_ID=CAMNT_0015349251 /DNA_START=299 /DNA_END=1309 /DNA_ORIENTATION=+
MTKADFAIAMFGDDGTLKTVNDSYANNKNAGFDNPLWDPISPYPGGTNDITHYSGIQMPVVENGKFLGYLSTFAFTKKCNTGDAAADNAIQNGTMTVIWAHGNDNQFEYHGPSNRGITKLNFMTGKVTVGSVLSSSTEYKQYHGSLMLGSFALLFLGIFVGRYMRKNAWWFWVHFTIQTAGICGIISAFGLIVYEVEDTKGDHFDSAHGIIGIIVVSIITIIVPFLGLVAHFMRDPTRKSPRIFPNMFHFWIARVFFLLSIVNLFLGMGELHLEKFPKIIFGVVVAVLTFVIILLELFAIEQGEHFLNRIFKFRLKSSSIQNLDKDPESMKTPLLD